MNFSVVLIARNEEHTLPKLMESLKEFRERGGEIVIADTGSTDKTVEVAESYGCKVTKCGDKFVTTLDAKMAKEINDEFIVEGEDPIVKEGDRIFNFAEARNFAATLASNDMIATPDCDEFYTTLDLDRIEKEIEAGADQFEYPFTFARDKDGNSLIEFTHCKFYNRKKLEWRRVVHEILSGVGKKVFLPKEVIKLEHAQNEKTDRSGYMRGLAYDCFIDRDSDRNLHYFGRELFWSGRFKSAIRVFEKHIAMKKWAAERAQSWLYIGDCYKYLKDDENAVQSYFEAIKVDASRREPMLKLAEFYKSKKDYLRTAIFAEASLPILESNFYSNHQPNYREVPHCHLYWAYFYLGQKERAKEHFKKAEALNPKNPAIIHDKQFFS
jgi:glycosyltransferase involved in cell wall biosynthesis